MANFVKREHFTLGSRRFKIISGMIYAPELPPCDIPNQVGNAVEFVEMIKDTEQGENFWKEKAPGIIANPTTKEQEFCNAWARMEGSNIRSKKELYELIENGKLILE